MTITLAGIMLPGALTMVVLGLAFGACLALASKIFHKDEDPRVEQALDALPGVNCAACGYGGCRAYAEAVVGGESVNLCIPGGPDVAASLAALMGVEAGETVRRRAVVHCQGGTDRCGQRADYDGPPDCRVAHITSGGAKACVFGCLGFGTCGEVCPFGAISMSDRELPVVDPEKCTACGVCVGECPRALISLLDVRFRTYLGCSSRDSGKAVKTACSVGCISCGMCAKKDANGAITMADELPVLDFEKSDGDFAVAAAACPMNCFVEEARTDQTAEQVVAAGEAVSD